MEYDMTKDIYVTNVDIKTNKTFVYFSQAEKRTMNGTHLQFIRVKMSNERKARGTKDTNSGVIWKLMI